MNIAKPDCYYIKIKKYTKLYIIHEIICKYIYCKNIIKNYLLLLFLIIYFIYLYFNIYIFLNTADEILIFWTCFFLSNIYFLYHHHLVVVVDLKSIQDVQPEALLVLIQWIQELTIITQ